MKMLMLQQPQQHHRDYSRVWWPARYVSRDNPLLRDRIGDARHVDGDTWQFAYRDDSGEPRWEDVYRTAISIDVGDLRCH